MRYPNHRAALAVQPFARDNSKEESCFAGPQVNRRLAPTAIESWSVRIQRDKFDQGDQFDGLESPSPSGVQGAGEEWRPDRRVMSGFTDPLTLWQTFESRSPTPTSIRQPCAPSCWWMLCLQRSRPS